ncbi:HisA/HisF-related TIM barrel protein [Rhodospirillaceae bacterium SYSU D60014]|uniref:HisA/HisF-related TIM barrel protein n=1 Tax=Virgifigura deserti TaxID=2268457 RepID=UPI000E6719C8
MQIIPVIDLKNGQAVHARLGQRDNYRPVRSRLCQSADPSAVIGAFRGIHRFETIYVADLDAIQGTGDNGAVLERVRDAFPDLNLWVDSGLADPTACWAWLKRGLGDLVLGSETLRDMAPLDELEDVANGGRLILSLDFREDRFLGPPSLLENPASWPERVVVMTLARVGSGRGPELDLLARLQAQAPAARLFAAGGVRHCEDLAQLAERRVGGVLVASALHDGRIDGPTIMRFHASARCP